MSKRRKITNNHNSNNRNYIQVASVSSLIPTHRHPTTFPDLPLEILTLIIEHLSKQELKNCALVCKHWYRSCAPFLWRQVLMKSYRQANNFLKPEAQAALGLFAHWVQKIDINFSCLLPTIAQAVATNGYYCNLLELSLGVTVYNEALQLVLDLIRFCPKIGKIFIKQDQPGDNILQILGVASTEYLQELNITAVISPMVAKRVLELVPPSIKTIALYVNTDHRWPSETLPTTQPPTVVPRHHRLQTIKLLGEFRGHEHSILAAFLKTCKKGTLRWVITPTTECFKNPCILEILRSMEVYKTSIEPQDFPAGCHSSDQELSYFIKSMPPLVSINVKDCFRLGGFTVEAISDHGPSLEELCISGCSNLDYHDFSYMLKCSTRMKSCIAMSSSPWHYKDDPRACKELFNYDNENSVMTHLECAIEVARHNRDLPFGKWTGDYSDMSRTEFRIAQGEVYDYLSYHERLEVLRLGYNYDHVYDPHDYYYHDPTTLGQDYLTEVEREGEREGFAMGQFSGSNTDDDNDGDDGDNDDDDDDSNNDAVDDDGVEDEDGGEEEQDDQDNEDYEDDEDEENYGTDDENDSQGTEEQVQAGGASTNEDGGGEEDEEYERDIDSMMGRMEDTPFQWHCLSMTLDSGMGVLRNLQRLRVLDIRGMNHRMGVRELEWIKTHWINLEKLYGLFMNGQPRNPDVVAWLEMHQPQWVVLDD
ncbi:hypothetical protein BGZ94_005872 [Podila epigama]|nr:hypothetical protein BGZ94_005872 [Podila epigama]